MRATLTVALIFCPHGGQKMKKKLLITLLAIIATLCCALGLTACNDGEHTHVFGEWETITEPTCTEKGTRQHTCTVCGETLTQSTYALGHKFGEWETITEPNCTEKGTRQHTCTVCGEDEITTVNNLGHSPVWQTEGETHWQICSVCKTELTEISAHTYKQGICECGHEHAHTWAETYTSEWTQHYQTCTGCDKLQYNSHTYTDSVCVCGKKEPLIGTKGLSYELNPDGKSYTLIGIGTATKNSDIVISSENEGLPVTAIRGNTFLNCLNLISVKIPESISSVSYYAFANCPALTIYCEAEEKPSDWHDNWNYAKCPVVWNCTKNDKDENGYAYVFWSLRLRMKDKNATVARQPSFLSGDISVSGSLTYKKEIYTVNSIENEAFLNCTDISSVFIYLGGYGVNSIRDNAFKGCSNLKNITIELAQKGSSVNIGENIFYGCPIETATIPANACKSIKNSYALKSVVITSGDIEENAFEYHTSLTNVCISDAVSSIGKYAFYGCSKLNDITIGNGITSIGNGAFSNCFIETATIPAIAINNIPKDNLKNIVITSGNNDGILDNAFKNCGSLTSVTISNGVTSVGNSAFEDCTSLESISIPDSVTSIGSFAFFNCSSLVSVYINNLVSWCAINFSDNPLSYAHNLYLNNQLVTNLIIPDDVTSIGSYAFSGCSSLTGITIPDGVTSIGGGAFEYCSSLTNITLPDSVTSIGSYAFEGCSSLTSITISDSVTSIGNYAFYGCDSLVSIKLPDSATKIGDYAFSSCDLLASITIPNGVTSIGGAAFEYCSSLTSITFNGTVSQWNTITKENHWNLYTGNYSVHCTDGEIAKDGTVTMH